MDEDGSNPKDTPPNSLVYSPPDEGSETHEISSRPIFLEVSDDSMKSLTPISLSPDINSTNIGNPFVNLDAYDAGGFKYFYDDDDIPYVDLTISDPEPDMDFDDTLNIIDSFMSTYQQQVEFILNTKAFTMSVSDVNVALEYLNLPWDFYNEHLTGVEQLCLVSTDADVTVTGWVNPFFACSTCIVTWYNESFFGAANYYERDTLLFNYLAHATFYVTKVLA